MTFCKFLEYVLGQSDKNTPISPRSSHSKGEGLNNIRHSMSIGNLSLDVKSFTASYLTRYDSLFQNATDIITKCDNYFVTKCNRSLLQSASGFSLQNAMQFYQKMQQLLQIDRQPIYHTCLFHHLIEQNFGAFLKDGSIIICSC